MFNLLLLDFDAGREKAFLVCKSALFFQLAFLICFFDFEVRFFGTAIKIIDKKLNCL